MHNSSADFVRYSILDGVYWIMCTLHTHRETPKIRHEECRVIKHFMFSTNFHILLSCTVCALCALCWAVHRFRHTCWVVNVLHRHGPYKTNVKIKLLTIMPAEAVLYIIPWMKRLWIALSQCARSQSQGENPPEQSKHAKYLIHILIHSIKHV